jgi:hypothetical protein
MLSSFSSCLLLLALLTALIVVCSNGTPQPDATHVVELLNNRGHRTYILPSQLAIMHVIEIMLLASMMVGVPAVLAARLFELVFPPRSWGYEPLDWKTESAPKRSKPQPQRPSPARGQSELQ